MCKSVFVATIGQMKGQHFNTIEMLVNEFTIGALCIHNFGMMLNFLFLCTIKKTLLLTPKMKPSLLDILKLLNANILDLQM